MSTDSSSMPVARRATRLSDHANTIAAHERLVAFATALIVAAIAFEPRIRTGGLLSDDWALYVGVKFPHATGFPNAWAALANAAGSRVGAIPYWLASFTLFGNHTRLYAAAAAFLAAVMAFSFYLLLRELRFSVIQSLAMMILTVVAPSVETVRFWFTPSGSQLCLALFFFGLTLALHAFSSPLPQRRYLHAASWVLYVASALYAEVALPLIAVSLLVYLTRASIARSLRRWAFDMIVVIGGYLGALIFVNSHGGFEPPSTSVWGEHAQQLGDQSLTIFTRMLGPLSDNARTYELAALAILTLACLWIWRRKRTTDGTRDELRRWALAFAIALAALVAGYFVYIPASVFYDPLSPGLGNRINIVAAAPLAVGLFSVLMLTWIVVGELLSSLISRPRQLASALIAAWFAVIAIAGLIDVRSDAHIWALAAARDNDELHTLTAYLPNPVQGSTVYAFGEGGTIVLGLPIFLSPWELRSAIKIAYKRGDLSAYPVVTNWDSLNCGSSGVTVDIGTAPANTPSPYGKTYFFDVPSGNYARIENMRSCATGLASFHPGPYSDTSLEWSQ